MGHVNKVSHVFTLSHVAEMLGEDEEWLFEVAEEMDTEDGQLCQRACGLQRMVTPTERYCEFIAYLLTSPSGGAKRG
jgi:hypothetical protein